ncbi:hypothetical protein [Nonomuraea sp. NPDC005650]|uniref:hypothetical protein n=1 Tax=Nonomuraea sp. NPDC005650 TaxID=3157045 RepID=UPI0033BCAD55
MTTSALSGARWLLPDDYTHHSDVARRHLVPGYDRPTRDPRYWRPNVELHDLLEIFSDRGVEVDLR